MTVEHSLGHPKYQILKPGVYSCKIMDKQN